MVSRGKPGPDLFLHAACDTGAVSGACIVVEDSPAGVVAAKRAGMRDLPDLIAGRVAGRKGGA